MAKCDICKEREGTRGAIISSTFYANVCDTCNNADPVSSGHARWARSIDAEDHEAEIQQPWNSDGTINTRFSKLYPKQAAALFSEEELRKAER